jgi:putative transcription factor
MMLCEMCGSQGNINADIEGVELNVCGKCAKYGIIKKSHRQLKKSSFKTNKINNIKNQSNSSLKLIDSFSSIMLKCRQEKGLKQEEFAEYLNERVSLVSKWELGTIKPSVEVAKNLEKKLGIRLTKNDEPLDVENNEKLTNNKSSREFTLGDFIKIRKRKA